MYERSTASRRERRENLIITDSNYVLELCDGDGKYFWRIRNPRRESQCLRRRYNNANFMKRLGVWGIGRSRALSLAVSLLDRGNN